MSKPPKPKGSTSTPPTTPDVETMHAKIVAQGEIKKLQLRMPEDLAKAVKILAIHRGTTPEKMAIEALERLVQEAQEEE